MSLGLILSWVPVGWWKLVVGGWGRWREGGAEGPDTARGGRKVQ